MSETSVDKIVRLTWGLKAREASAAARKLKAAGKFHGLSDKHLTEQAQIHSALLKSGNVTPSLLEDAKAIHDELIKRHSAPGPRPIGMPNYSATINDLHSSLGTTKPTVRKARWPAQRPTGDASLIVQPKYKVPEGTDPVRGKPPTDKVIQPHYKVPKDAEVKVGSPLTSPRKPNRVRKLLVGYSNVS